MCEVYIVLVYCGVGIIKTRKCSTGTQRYRATDSKSKHKQIFVFASQIQFVKETSSQEYENSLKRNSDEGTIKYVFLLSIETIYRADRKIFYTIKV